ncbi:hypothetical protein D3C72_1445340 [compost metagenome]
MAVALWLDRMRDPPGLEKAVSDVGADWRDQVVEPGAQQHLHGIVVAGGDRLAKGVHGGLGGFEGLLRVRGVHAGNGQRERKRQRAGQAARQGSGKA